MRKILRRMVFKQALKTKSQRQEKQCLKEDSKKMKKKVSSVKDLIFGAFTALELFLRIGWKRGFPEGNSRQGSSCEVWKQTIVDKRCRHFPAQCGKFWSKTLTLNGSFCVVKTIVHLLSSVLLLNRKPVGYAMIWYDIQSDVFKTYSLILNGLMFSLIELFTKNRKN